MASLISHRLPTQQRTHVTSNRVVHRYRLVALDLNDSRAVASPSDRVQRRHANLALSENISAVLENLLKNYDSTQRPASGLGGSARRQPGAHRHRDLSNNCL